MGHIDGLGRLVDDRDDDDRDDDKPKPCKRCGHAETQRFAICLVNIDEDSIDEGEHAADVELWLCSDCEEHVADALLPFREYIGTKAGTE